MTITTTISNDVSAKMDRIAERNDVKRAEVGRELVIHFVELAEKEQDAVIFQAVKKMRVMALGMRREALQAEMKKIAIEIGIYDKELNG